MQSKPEAYEILNTLLTTQRLAVVATVMRGRPYTSLVAFAASEDLRRVVFCTTRATTKYRNLSEEPNVSVLIDSRTHSVEDFATGAAVTAIGKAAELPASVAGPTVERFLRKHSHLEAFVRSPSTALCSVEVEKYYLVTRFQHVVEMDVTQWSSSNHSRT
jgi:nitroimidazol reductase NimA-like FMN-containing flavoprotein (pyridoxamine 5'-phosphate oxidase superfamily)